MRRFIRSKNFIIDSSDYDNDISFWRRENIMQIKYYYENTNSYRTRKETYASEEIAKKRLEEIKEIYSIGRKAELRYKMQSAYNFLNGIDDEELEDKDGFESKKIREEIEREEMEMEAKSMTKFFKTQGAIINTECIRCIFINKDIIEIGYADEDGYYHELKETYESKKLAQERFKEIWSILRPSEYMGEISDEIIEKAL